MWNTHHIAEYFQVNLTPSRKRMLIICWSILLSKFQNKCWVYSVREGKAIYVHYRPWHNSLQNLDWRLKGLHLWVLILPAGDLGLWPEGFFPNFSRLFPNLTLALPSSWCNLLWFGLFFFSPQEDFSEKAVEIPRKSHFMSGNVSLCIHHVVCHVFSPLNGPDSEDYRSAQTVLHSARIFRHLNHLKSSAVHSVHTNSPLAQSLFLDIRARDWKSAWKSG